MGEKYIKFIFNLDRAKKLITFLLQFAKKEKSVYNLKSIKIPRTSGRTLKILAFLLRSPGSRSILIPVLLRQAGIQILRKCQVEDEPILHPFHPAENKITSSVAKKSIKLFLKCSFVIVKTFSPSGVLGKEPFFHLLFLM